MWPQEFCLFTESQEVNGCFFTKTLRKVDPKYTGNLRAVYGTSIKSYSTGVIDLDLNMGRKMKQIFKIAEVC